ncbi:MAG: hypothetical protein SGBAC_006804 [Bacillariaceae sp.]
MKHVSKTMTTLTILRQHNQEEEEEKEAMEQQEQQQRKRQLQDCDSRDEVDDRDLTPLPFYETSVDVVEFHPEDIAPLKPEEADELQLADILQGEDLSFLVEIKDDSDANVPSVPRPKSITMHRIPSDFLVTYDTIGNKRRRLSSMDGGW